LGSSRCCVRWLRWLCKHDLLCHGGAFSLVSHTSPLPELFRGSKANKGLWCQHSCSHRMESQLWGGGPGGGRGRDLVRLRPWHLSGPSQAPPQQLNQDRSHLVLASSLIILRSKLIYNCLHTSITSQQLIGCQETKDRTLRPHHQRKSPQKGPGKHGQLLAKLLKKNFICLVEHFKPPFRLKVYVS
jgi:hypothetical protein